MANTNQTDRALSKIAYWDLTDDIEFYQIAGQRRYLRDIIADDQAKKDKLLEFGFDIDDPNDPSYQWQLVATYDTNQENGFYACVIETSPGNVTVAFRGSEADDAKEFVDDWGRADVGLLNRMETEQHEECDRFLHDSTYRSILMRYGNITFTGHSLGGNLAEHAGVMCADDVDLSDRIDSIVSLDGPGFSWQYLNEHRGQIEVVASRTHHFRWSLVGGLLFGLPGASDYYVKADQEKYDESNSSLPFAVVRHKLEYLHVTEGGWFTVDGDGPAEWERDVGAITGLIDLYLYAFDKPKLSVKFRGGSWHIRLWSLGSTLTHFGNSLSGTLGAAEKGDRYRASAEADEHGDIYIDVDRFRELADTCASLIRRLETMSSELQDIDEGAVETVAVPSNIHGSALIQQALGSVYKVINFFKQLENKVGHSKAYVDDSIRTLKGVETYLSETGYDFWQVEVLAKNLIKDWERLI